MDSWVRQALRCPNCRSELADGTGKLICLGCHLAYPMRDSIPAILAGRAIEITADEA
jgi:uncharacterized protein YbaR (Trm112 family)